MPLPSIRSVGQSHINNHCLDILNTLPDYWFLAIITNSSYWVTYLHPVAQLVTIFHDVWLEECHIHQNDLIIYLVYFSFPTFMPLLPLFSPPQITFLLSNYSNSKSLLRFKSTAVFVCQQPKQKVACFWIFTASYFLCSALCLPSCVFFASTMLYTLLVLKIYWRQELVIHYN